MKRLTLSLAAVAAGLIVAPNLASALSAVTASATNLRAGPAFDFPVVDRLPADVRVNVHGCVRGYRWCDISWRDARGWAPGEELAYLYQGRRVTVVEYGPRIGLPVVGFAFDTYWDRYYRGRVWYGERARWRTVWRERERGEARTGARVKDRPEGRIETRTDRREVDRTERRSERSRREVDRGRIDNGERGLDRRSGRSERPNVRTGRGDSRERGEVRGYNPQTNASPRHGGPRQEMNRGTPRDANPGGRGGPSMSPGPKGQGGHGQGGAERGEHKR